MTLLRVAIVASLLLVAPGAGVLGAQPSEDAQASKTRSKGRASKAKQRKAKQRKVRRKRAARKRRARQRRKAAQRRRKAARKKRANRPKGWQWPPTKAMQAQGRECLKELTALGVDWKKAGRKKGIVTPIRVPSLTFGRVELWPTFRKPPFVMDCHLALALTKAGPAIEKAGVSELRFSSIYSYRKAKVGGVTKDALSRHSYGLAVDVYEVRDDLGEVFEVESQYASEDVIRRLEEVLNETGLFRLVLSPANDPASHSDHLHLEARVSALSGKRVAKRKRKRRKRRKR